MLALANASAGAPTSILLLELWLCDDSLPYCGFLLLMASLSLLLCCHTVCAATPIRRALLNTERIEGRLIASLLSFRLIGTYHVPHPWVRDHCCSPTCNAPIVLSCSRRLSTRGKARREIPRLALAELALMKGIESPFGISPFNATID